MKTRLLVVLAVLLCCCCFLSRADAAGIEMPLEGATAVWIQPLDSTPGTYGATATLTLPEKFVGQTIADLIKFEAVIHQEGGQVRIDPGLSLSPKTDIGIPVKVGVLALPMTKYKVGWFVGATIVQITL